MYKGVFIVLRKGIDYMKRLFIAEKPSLAQAIFEGLGGKPNTKMINGVYEIGDDKITCCFGHALEIYDPEDYDEKYKIWSLDDLPIKAVFPPKLKPKTESLERLKVIEKLLQVPDIKVINAFDADAEGMAIFTSLTTYFNYTKPTLRVLISDLNLKAVQKALADLRPNEDFQKQADTALARAISDQLFGYNLTRGYTVKAQAQGFGSTIAVGRIQSAVLGLVNSRTLANQNHEASFYYDISANFQSENGLLKAKYQPNDNDNVDEKTRLIDENNANSILTEINGKQGVISEVKNTIESKAAPLPYSLSALQQVCAKKYGYSAEETLEIAQKLYENHKLTSYPRSDCRYLSDEHLQLKDSILNAVAGTRPDLKDAINTCENIQHKAFDATKITAHHAICPTEKSGEGINLTDKEKNVYELIALNFISLFYPDSVRNKTKVTLAVNDRIFVSTQTVLNQQGWETLFKGEIETDQPIDGVDLSTLKKGVSVDCKNQSIDKKKTNPPKYFFESSLLAAMSRAAKFVNDPTLRAALEAKDKGNASEHGSIGTEATRAGILAKLAESPLISIETVQGYKEKVWKTTQSGQEFCLALPDEITAPDISAIWSGYQADILLGTMTVEEFVFKVETYIAERIQYIKDNSLNITSTMESCPKCKVGFLKRLKGAKNFFYACTNDSDCKTTYPETNGKPNLTPKVAVQISAVHKCKECNSGLIRRRKSKLVKGKPSFFWGCSAYPECEQVYSERGGLPVFK